MNIDLFTSTFDVNTGAAQTSFGAVAESPAGQSDAITPNIAKPTNTTGADRSDNSPPVTQDASVTEPSETFSQTLDKKIKSQTPEDAQTDEKTEKPAQNAETPSENIVLAVQNELTQPMVLDKEISPKADDQQAETQTSPKPETTQLVPVSESTQAPPLVVQVAKAVTPDPDQIASANPKPDNHPQKQAEIQTSPKPETTQLVPASESTQPLPLIAQGAKAVTPDPDQIAPANSKQVDEPIKPVINQTPVKSAAMVPVIANKTPISDVQTADGKNVEKPQISDNVIITNKQIAIDNEAVAGEKPVTIGESEIAAKTTANLGDANESTSKTLIGDQLPQTLQKSPIPTADNTTSDKPDTGQKGNPDKTEIFESPENNKIQTETFSVKSIPQKTSQTQAVVSQVRNPNNLIVDKAPNPDVGLPEQILAGNNVQSGDAEQTSTPVASMKTAGNTNPDATVSQQIQESVQTSLRMGNQQIVIRLDPPELGKVAITFTEKGGEITGFLQVDKLQTRNQIQQELPEIIQNLQDSGVQIKKLEVVLTNQQNQYTSKDQSSNTGQGTFSEHQNSSNPESQTNNTTYNEWRTNIDNGTQFTEPQMQLTDTSINMLI